MQHLVSRIGSVLEHPGILAILLLTPAGLIVFGGFLFPMVSSFILSFTELTLTNPQSGIFIGVRNYGEALRSTFFWAAFGRMLYFAVISVMVRSEPGISHRSALTFMEHISPIAWDNVLL